MQKRLKNTISGLLLLILGTFSSCESDLHLQLKEGGGQLVLFAFPTADSTLSLHLSRSVNHSSLDDFERIYDGYLALYRNGARVDSFAWPYKETWAQRTGLPVREGDVWTIRGGDSKGQRISATTTIPQAVAIEGLDSIGRGSKNGDSFIQYELIFTDPPEIDNYYQLLIFGETRDSLNHLLNRQTLNYGKTDEVFYIRDQEGSLLGGIDFLGSFSDYLIQGQPHRLKVGIPSVYLSSPNPGEKLVIRFCLLSLSPDYYHYLRSRIVAEYNYDLPVVDPIKIYSNTTGGLGLVGGMSIASDSLVLIGSDYE